MTKHTVEIKGRLQQPDDPEFHFADIQTSSQDKLAGDIMANKIGDTFIEWRNEAPVDQWTQIIKALRVHGFEINFKEE